MTFACTDNDKTVKSPSSTMDIFDLTLHDLNGKAENFTQLKRYKGSIIAFLFPDCPIAQRTMPQIREIADSCRQNNVKFMGIVPGNFYELDSLKTFHKEYELPFPLLLDPNFKLCRMLGASVSPEAFLLDTGGKIRYRGQIDNAFFALGRQRNKTTRHYLKNALHLYVNNQPIHLTETKPIGCFLYDTDQNQNKR